MTKHLFYALERLKAQLLELGNAVERNLSTAIEAFETRNVALAGEMSAADRHIDMLEVEVEEECLKLLALHQPVAMDLRFIVAVLKINSDLERIGDFAVNISWRVIDLEDHGAPKAVFNLRDMAARAQLMLRESLRALVELDSERAREVLRMDDVVDSENRRIHQEALSALRAHPENAESYLATVGVSRALERVADHSTNIAEDVIYMVDGEIARHGRGL